MMRLRIAICLVILLAPARAITAADDTLLQAVSFVITGSDSSLVTVIDRAQCVFKVGDATYFFNNRVEPHLRRDEEGFLGAFDANRDLIFRTAAEVHSRDRKTRYELVGADFR